MARLSPETGRPEPGASLRRFYRQYRTFGVEQNLLSVATQQKLSNRRPAAQADDDQLGILFGGALDQVLAGRLSAHIFVDSVGNSQISEPALDLGECFPIGQDLIGVLFVATLHRMDHDQLSLPQLDLLNGPIQSSLTCWATDETNDNLHSLLAPFSSSRLPARHPTPPIPSRGSCPPPSSIERRAHRAASRWWPDATPGPIPSWLASRRNHPSIPPPARPRRRPPARWFLQPRVAARALPADRPGTASTAH